MPRLHDVSCAKRPDTSTTNEIQHRHLRLSSSIKLILPFASLGPAPNSSLPWKVSSFSSFVPVDGTSGAVCSDRNCEPLFSAFIPAKAFPNRLLLGPARLRGFEGGEVGLDDEEDAAGAEDGSVEVDRPPMRDARSLAALLGIDVGAGA
jgi:hypothetical protein